MLITRVELENIKSYRRLTVDLQRGTTAISGVNGSGKTTIVEAIGYALFDSLAYNQGQFVREGERYGRIVIHLVGGDDRAYVVERRCGAGAYWLLNDDEANYRLEQKADVQDKLHELFGIDRERPLNKLFQDALGVPQGTFTSIFLQTASIRKQTFDALLQIEDYRTAFDYLLDAQKQYKEQAQVQFNDIQRLTYETRELEEWRAQLETLRRENAERTQKVNLWTQELTLLEKRFTALSAQREKLNELETRRDQRNTEYESAQQILQERQRSLESARAAHQAVEASRADHERYQQANETLLQLHEDDQLRQKLNKQLSDQQRALAAVMTTLTHLHGRLEEVAAARQRVIELSPLVDKQIELEKERDELMRKVTQYDGLVVEGKRLVQLHASYLQQQRELQQRILSIEPLQPLAALLQERVESVANLRALLNEQNSKQRSLQEKQEQTRQKRQQQETYTAKQRSLDSTITKIETHRAEAEAMPTMQHTYEQCSQQLYRLEGNIEGYLRSRKQSVGGQCPFLQEPCLNIQRKGIASLESYFDGLVATDRTQLESITIEQSALAERLNSVKKFAEALNKLTQYVEQRDTLSEHLARLADEIAQLDREISALNQDLAAYTNIQQQIARAERARSESQKADEQVRELAGLRMQVQQLVEQAAQCDLTIQERRQQARELQGCGAQLQQVEAQLKTLGDPRAQTRTQLAIIAQEPTHLQQLQAGEQKQAVLNQRIGELEQQLVAYSDLDERIREHNEISKKSKEGYHAYVSNINRSRELPQRLQAFEEGTRQIEQATARREAAALAYLQAKANFDEHELIAVTNQWREMRDDLAHLVETINHANQQMYELERKIQRAEELMGELEKAQKEKATLDELHTMMEQFRKLIKDAAPFVLKAMLSDVSAEANRIFGEIMGDRTAQLSWQNDYEILLRRQGVNRSFAQLSGGEQMSAALAVRLALLKKLSTLNIAFFDEPTQNMDELRRMNLAEQIRRVRGFDQLIVISHDDTFEQGLDSIIRLRKTNGETHLISEGEHIALEREQVGAP